jgi:hypothetical protein
LTAGVSRGRTTGWQSLRLELLVDRLVVVAHVHDGDLGAEPRERTDSSSGIAKVDSASLAEAGVE